MSDKERLEYKEELSSYSKEEMIEKYIDEVEENEIITNQWYKSTQKIKKATELIKENVYIDYYGVATFRSQKCVDELLETLGDKE